MADIMASYEALRHREVARFEPPRELQLLTLDECAAAAPREYIVKGLLARGDLALLVGQPGSGKSVLAPLLSHAVAAGRRFFGKRVKAGPVLYIAAEDGTGMQMRAAALLRSHGRADGMLIMPEHVALHDDGMSGPPLDLAAIAAAADRIGAVLIVLDTLAAAFPGLEENSGLDMGRAVSLMRMLGSDRRAVLAVHHPTKAGGETPRGHGVLNGAADVILRIRVPEDQEAPREVTMGKNRNGPTLGNFAFHIRAETLGVDDDGDLITAPVAHEAESAEVGTKRSRLPASAGLALDYLATLILAEGNRLPAGEMFPPHDDLRCVPMDAWREVCRQRSLAQSTERRAVNQAFARASRALMEARQVATAEHGGVILVWATKGAGT